MSQPGVDKLSTPVLSDENALKLGIFATNLRGGATLADVPGNLQGTWEETLGVALSVPRMTAADLDALERHLARMRAAAGPVEFNEAHAAFHAGLVARCDAPLRAEIERLMARADRYRRMSVFGDDPAGRRAGDREHGEVLAACRARDGREASRSLAAHLARSALTLLAQLAPDAQPVAVRAALTMLRADYPVCA